MRSNQSGSCGTGVCALMTGAVCFDLGEMDAGFGIGVDIGVDIASCDEEGTIGVILSDSD